MEVRGDHGKYGFTDFVPLHLIEMGDQIILWSLTLTPALPLPSKARATICINR
jgi:hypothetical protein